MSTNSEWRVFNWKCLSAAREELIGGRVSIHGHSN
jgi:hypothetical protein